MKNVTKNNKNNKNKWECKKVLGVLLIVAGVSSLVALVCQILGGALTNAFAVRDGYYFPVAWKLALLPFLIAGVSATVLGVKMILNKNHNYFCLAVLAFTLLTTVAMSLLVKPQVYMNNFSGVTELVDTAVEEYSGFKGDDKIRLHTETMFGEKTPEASKKLQNAVDSQADFNLVSVYLIGVISTAVFFAILSLGKTAKK